MAFARTVPSFVRLAVAHPGSAARSGFDAGDRNSAMASGSASCRRDGSRHGARQRPLRSKPGQLDHDGQAPASLRWLEWLRVRAGASAGLWPCRLGRAQDQTACRRWPSARLVASVSAALSAMSCTSPGDVPRPSPVPWPSRMMVAPSACTVSAHPGDVDGKESPLVLAGKDAFGFDGLPAPAVKAEDPVGLRDRVPALEVGQFPAIGLAGADMAVVWD